MQLRDVLPLSEDLMGLANEIADFIREAEKARYCSVEGALLLLKRAMSRLLSIEEAQVGGQSSPPTCAVCAPDPPKPPDYELSGGHEAYAALVMPIRKARLLASAAIAFEAQRLLLESAREQPRFVLQPGEVPKHATAEVLASFAEAICPSTKAGA